MSQSYSERHRLPRSDAERLESRRSRADSDQEQCDSDERLGSDGSTVTRLARTAVSRVPLLSRSPLPIPVSTAL